MYNIQLCFQRKFYNLLEGTFKKIFFLSCFNYFEKVIFVYVGTQKIYILKNKHSQSLSKCSVSHWCNFNIICLVNIHQGSWSRSLKTKYLHDFMLGIREGAEKNISYCFAICTSYVIYVGSEFEHFLWNVDYADILNIVRYLEYLSRKYY